MSVAALGERLLEARPAPTRRPGSMSSGKMTCSLARAWASWRAASSSSTAAASDAALPVAPVASSGASTALPGRHRAVGGS